MIRLTVPSIEADDLEAVRAVLESGYLVQGPRVAAMEEQLAAYLGVKHVVAVSNGTAALHLALLSLGVGPGDLVVTTAYSWPATANVIELCGARPVFVDIEPDTFNLSPDRLEGTLAELMGKPETAGKVRAILPVHAFGQLADMPRILELAGRYDLPVVEDAACALGATWQGRQAGTWGIMGCFSLHPRKAITTGEGGFVITDDAGLARRLRTLRNHGLDPQAAAPDFVEPGFNYRMTEFQAALGSTQLAKLDRILAARRQGAARYDMLLADSPLRTPKVRLECTPTFQTYVTLLPSKAASRRPEIIRTLKERGVETTIGTIHIPMTTYYRGTYGFAKGDFAKTDEAAYCSLALPLFEGISRDDQLKVTGALRLVLVGERLARQ